MAKKSKKEKEIFKIEKKGEEKVIEKDFTEEVSEVKTGQIAKENKILRNILIFLGIIIVAILVWIYLHNKINTVEYDGVKFDVLDENGVTFYHTTFPNKINGKEYNVYLRNSPKETSQIEFKGKVLLSKMVVINGGNDFRCDGDGVIAVANVNQIFRDGLGATIITDPEAKCDEMGRYTLINIVNGTGNEVKQIGVSCYEIQVKDCEILPSTERFILEMIKVARN